MSWLELPDDDATPELKRATAQWRREQRPVPAVIAVMKHRPNVLRTVSMTNAAISFGGSTLGRRREEMISTFVSAINDCYY